MRPVIEDYIRIVKDKSLLRKLMLICSAAIARAADQSETALEVLDAAESQLLEVSEKGITRGLEAARPDCPEFLWLDRQSLQAEPRSYRPRHRIHRTRSHDQRPAKGRTGHHCRAPLHGQDRFCHQHRAERSHQEQGHCGRLQPGNEQGVAAAPHAGLAGLGRPAQAADRLSGPRRPGKTAERTGAACRVAVVHR